MRPFSPTTASVLNALDRAGSATLRDIAQSTGLQYERTHAAVSNLVRAGRLTYSTTRKAHSCRPVAVYCRADTETQAVPRAAEWWAAIDDAWRQ